MVAETVALGVALLVLIAEILHAPPRVPAGPGSPSVPSRRPAAWTALAPVVRVGSSLAVTWGLVTLIQLKPKTHQAESVPDKDKRKRDPGSRRVPVDAAR